MPAAQERGVPDRNLASLPIVMRSTDRCEKWRELVRVSGVQPT
jgi:hypothetical protein